MNPLKLFLELVDRFAGKKFGALLVAVGLIWLIFNRYMALEQPTEGDTWVHVGAMLALGVAGAGCSIGVGISESGRGNNGHPTN